jgi:hypothetical protein
MGDIGEDEKNREIKRIEPLEHPNPAKRPAPQQPVREPEKVPVTVPA